MLRDQRTMTGVTPLDSQEAVKNVWGHYAQMTGRIIVESNVVLHAYVSDGRWVADCGTPGCTGGLACWPEHKQACCLDCFTLFSVKFPPRRQIEDATVVLMEREEVNRNWRPDRGEKVAMLVAENLAVGVTK